ncbi:MAG: DUF3859 domain-containing protein [Flammeovirgaceae bacterium]|nr:DUF3859 domain-containing protein [Flammeovirgaceae bacterium]
MAKKKAKFDLISYGRYSRWDRESNELPKIVDLTHKIPAIEDEEFGYIMEVKSAKGKRIYFMIEHPSFKDESGKTVPPFTGEIFIKTNPFRFFLGDCIWHPVKDKVGIWKITTKYDGKIIMEKSFEIFLPVR